MGQDLNLSPVVVFISLFIWSFLLGGIGMLLAMPLTVLLVLIFERFQETRWLAVLMSTNVTTASEEQAAAVDSELDTGSTASISGHASD